MTPEDFARDVLGIDLALDQLPVHDLPPVLVSRHGVAGAMMVAALSQYAKCACPDCLNPAPPPAQPAIRRMFWQSSKDRPETHVELVLEDLEGNRLRAPFDRGLIAHGFRGPSEVMEMTWPQDGLFGCRRHHRRA